MKNETLLSFSIFKILILNYLVVTFWRIQVHKMWDLHWQSPLPLFLSLYLVVHKDLTILKEVTRDMALDSAKWIKA